MFGIQQYIAPAMSLFGPINIPMNAYNNYRVYGTILCFLMFVCVFIGVKFVSKFSPIALFCVIISILCVYIGIFVSNPDRGPKSVPSSFYSVFTFVNLSTFLRVSYRCNISGVIVWSPVIWATCQLGNSLLGDNNNEI